MSNGESLSQRWENFRPTKALWLWSCAGCVIGTMIVGFTFGGWVTGGTATEMAEQANEDARVELAASLCVNQFVADANAATTFAELKEASSWKRDDVIQDGGWATIAGLDEDISGTADLCADKIVAMEELPALQIAEPAEPVVSGT